MKLKYKGVQIEIDENDFMTILTEDEVLKNEFALNGVIAERIESIENYLKRTRTKLITNKDNVVNRKITTIGKITSKEPAMKGLINYELDVPGKRTYFELTANIDLEVGKYYELDGELKLDTWYNKNRATTLERHLGYNRYRFKSKRIKEIRIKEKEVNHEIPRYELHCHTIHSKRDGHITHDEISEGFDSGKLGILAITNHGTNGCFPDAISNFGKGDKRVIPAVELYVVDDEILDLEITKFEAENNEFEIRRTEIELEKETIEKLIAVNLKIIDEKTYVKGAAGIIKKENVGYRKELTMFKKEIKEIEKAEKEIKKLRPSLGDAPRRHVSCLVKSKDSIMKYKGKDVAFNPGIYELNKAITLANTTNMGIPEVNKWMGKRGIVTLSELKKLKETGHFIFGAACSLGFITDNLIENDPATAANYIDLFDYIEVQPIRNNLYLLEAHHYPMFKTKDDLKKLNRKIFEFGRLHKKKIIFASDAHVYNEDDSYKRAIFKKSFFSMLFFWRSAMKMR